MANGDPVSKDPINVEPPTVEEVLTATPVVTALPVHGVGISFEPDDLPNLKQGESIIIRIGQAEKRIDVPPGKVIKNLRISITGWLDDAVV